MWIRLRPLVEHSTENGSPASRSMATRSRSNTRRAAATGSTSRHSPPRGSSVPTRAAPRRATASGAPPPPAPRPSPASSASPRAAPLRAPAVVLSRLAPLGGAARTAFWLDPAADLLVLFLPQLLPSWSFNFRGQLKAIIYPAIVDGSAGRGSR